MYISNLLSFPLLYYYIDNFPEIIAIQCSNVDSNLECSRRRRNVYPLYACVPIFSVLTFLVKFVCWFLQALLLNWCKMLLEFTRLKLCYILSWIYMHLMEFTRFWLNLHAFDYLSGCLLILNLNLVVGLNLLVWLNSVSWQDLLLWNSADGWIYICGYFPTKGLLDPPPAPPPPPLHKKMYTIFILFYG